MKLTEPTAKEYLWLCAQSEACREKLANGEAIVVDKAMVDRDYTIRRYDRPLRLRKVNSIKANLAD